MDEMKQTSEEDWDEFLVNSSADAMRRKLAHGRLLGRGGWWNKEKCSTEVLAKLFVDHLSKTSSDNFVDLANIAMMLHMWNADPEVLVAAMGESKHEIC